MRHLTPTQVTVPVAVWLCVTVGCAWTRANQAASVTVNERAVSLAVGGKVAVHFQEDNGWFLESVQVREAGSWRRTYRPQGSNGFFDNDTRPSRVTSDREGTRQRLTFHAEGWSVSYWVDESESVPWIHVATKGAPGKQVRYRTVSASTSEEGAGYIAYTAYNHERDIDGAWRPVHFGWPYAVGHSLVDDDDVGYLVVFENATCLPDSVEYKSHAEMDFTYGRSDVGEQHYCGYFGIRYDPPYEMQYRITFTLGKAGKKISGILRDYMHGLFVEFHPDSSRLDADFVWDDMRQWFDRIYKDPSYWHEDSAGRTRGIVPMECEYDDADGTFADGTEFGSSQGVPGPLMYMGFATRNEAQYSYWFHKSVAGRDPQFNNLFLHLRGWRDDYDPSRPYDLPPWGAINWRQQWAQHVVHLFDITGSRRYSFTPMSQYLTHVSQTDEYTGPVRWDTLSATKARDLLLHDRLWGNPAFREDGCEILDTVINPKVEGWVENPQDSLPSGPAHEGTAPEACLTSAMANVERYLITGDARFKAIAEDFAYMGLTLFSLRPYNNTYAVSGGSSCGSERDSMHAVMETQIDTANGAYLLIGLLKTLDIDAAYHMLYLMDQNLDRYCFNVSEKPEIGVYMYGVPHLLYTAFHLVNDTDDHRMLVVCPDVGLYAPEIHTERDVHVYNPTAEASEFTLFIKSLNPGSYAVVAGEELLGVYSHERLAAGLGVRLDPREIRKYRVAPRSPVASQGRGLRGDYFNNPGAGPNDYVLGRIDSAIDFAWREAPADGVRAEGFSVVWRGEIEPPTTGLYAFTVPATDGVRLFLNWKIVIDQWIDQEPQAEASATIRLHAGIRYPIRVEFSNPTGRADARLEWEGPLVERQVVPRQQLYPDALVPLNGTTDVTYLSDISEDFHRQFFWRPGIGCDQKGLNSPCPNPDFQTLKKDTSVAGQPLRLNGKTYPKGLGTHNESVIEYTLESTHDYFLADIGIDDEVNEPGARSGFKVLGDGVPLFDSGLMSPESPTQSLDVCVRGVRTLMLQVYRGPNTKLGGHANWADARLVGSQGGGAR